jgi:hypothetical protein
MHDHEKGWMHKDERRSPSAIVAENSAVDRVRVNDLSRSHDHIDATNYCRRLNRMNSRARKYF